MMARGGDDVNTHQSIAAIILSYSSPTTLRDLLKALSNQTLLPTTVLVIDNAGTPPVEIGTRQHPFALRVERKTVNDGPGGGWAWAIERYLGDLDETFAWLLDDDLIPNPDCLELLYSRIQHSPVECVRPIVHDAATDALRSSPSWCGPLLGRQTLMALGAPRRDLVWWAEDAEYFMDRFEHHGFTQLTDETAVVRHNGVRRLNGTNPAKIYYETRNTVWLRTHVRGCHKRPSKWSRLARSLIVNFLRASRAKPRASAQVAYWLGVSHGVTGRLGHRYVLRPGRLSRALVQSSNSQGMDSL